MKKNIKLLAAFASGVILCGVFAFGQNATSTNSAAADQEQSQKLVRVATLSSIEANLEFQRNVQIMQARRQQIIDLQSQLQRAGTDSARERIQSEIDEALERLNADNKLMIDTYGFSLNRSYTLVVEKSHIYMLVSDEEAAAVEKASSEENEENRSNW